ncbi:Ca2+ calmodulin-dependent kinase [Lecanosticta acicola]|uniref:non-specific serine/threonine protein kinase n=1 Tax=Lecanosticta acicola TaxID=111012 RepID=A0AAI8Z8G1_9PEZI|nr:Ca2+ calmodulin-dependent kinase [Lecanosticta acicola]
MSEYHFKRKDPKRNASTRAAPARTTLQSSGSKRRSDHADEPESEGGRSKRGRNSGSGRRQDNEITQSEPSQEVHANGSQRLRRSGEAAEAEASHEGTDSYRDSTYQIPRKQPNDPTEDDGRPEVDDENNAARDRDVNDGLREEHGLLRGGIHCDGQEEPHSNSPRSDHAPTSAIDQPESEHAKAHGAFFDELYARIPGDRAWETPLWRYAEFVTARDHFNEVSLYQKIDMLKSILETHGVNDDWSLAPPFKRYVDGDLLPEDAWPPLQEELEKMWEDMRTELVTRRASRHAIQEFDAMCQKASAQGYLFELPEAEGRQPDDYVENELRPVFIQEATNFYEPHWNNDVKEHGQDSYDSMKASVRSGLLPWGPEEDRWRTRWAEMGQVLQDHNSDARSLGRFQGLHNIAEHDFRLYGDLLRPYQFDDSFSNKLPEYCAQLDKFLSGQRYANRDKAWIQAIEDARYLDEHAKLREDFQYNVKGSKELSRPPRSHFNRVPPGVTSKQHSRAVGPRQDLGGFWNFKGALGSGMCGSASLWAREDHHARIVERIVVKDSQLLQNMDWNSSANWYGDIHMRIPYEWITNRWLKACEESINVVECKKAYSIYDELHMYRVYLEYCPHGTLEDLIARHDRLRRPEIRAFDGQRIPHRIPVRALWAIFEALVSAVCLMRHGRLPDQDERRTTPDHRTILHLDIKPENVLLAEPNKELWPGIPVPKVADFGIAIIAMTDEDAPYGDGSGTRGYFPPEQALLSYEYHPEWYRRYRMSTASDVWSIGRTMLSLMKITQVETIMYEEYKYFDFDRGGDVPEFGDAEEIYPAALCDLVKACLQRLPPDRIPVDQLWSNIHMHVASCEGLSARVMKLDPEDPNELLDYKEDQYTLFTRTG